MLKTLVYTIKTNSKLIRTIMWVIALALMASLFLDRKVFAASDIQLLNNPWHLVGSNGAREAYQSVDRNILQNKKSIKIAYDLHGLCALDGDASAIIFDQDNGEDFWHYVSLSKYGKNCQNGLQTVEIPLSDFKGLDTSKPISGMIHTRFWGKSFYTVDISSITVSDNDISPTVTPKPTIIPVSTTPTPSPIVATEVKLLNNPWQIKGNNGAGEAYQSIDKNILQGKNAVKITYDLHGLCALGDDASAIIFDQNNGGENWHYISLSKYGQNCKDGSQTVTIPLSDFKGLDLTKPNDGTLHARVWSKASFTVDVSSIVAVGSGATVPTASPTPAPTVTLVPTATPKPTITLIPTSTPAPTVTPASTKGNWAIQSVDSMKETKDKICGQDNASFINSWIGKAKELGVNYITVDTPYDSPACGDSVAYAKAWSDAIHAQGLGVWHRHMPLAFESIYDTPKQKSDFLSMISNYIKNNKGLFKSGDIFTPIPEPQNGGINGITGCANGVCQYDNAAAFNKWLRDAIDVSESAFASIGLGGQMKIGYYGFDGFVAWGSNNPDWHGILEDATVQKMGNIAIDHYPELIGQTMKQGLDEVQAKYPNTPIIISEWGAAGSSDQVEQVLSSMGAAAHRNNIVGFNYWQMGMGGNEALINNDFSNKPGFTAVQSFFTGQR